MHQPTADTLAFLTGGGEMGALMRRHDWSCSSLGAPANWPQSLRTAVRLLLNTGHPMYIFWGSDGACLYNDPYRQSIGPERHPGSLGLSARAVWDEIWDIIGPQIEQVMAGRGATWNVDHLVPITRNGVREEVYWTYSYSPIDDEGAPYGVGGVLVVCTETTQKVLAERRIAAESARQRRLFERAPSFIAILNGPEHVFEFVNEAYTRLTGRSDFIGKPIRQAIPDIAGQGFYELLDKVFDTGVRYVAQQVPITLQRSSKATAEERFLDFIYEPIIDEGGKVTGIFVEGHDVTETHRAQEEIRMNERRQALLVELGDRLRDLDDPTDLSFAAAEILGRALNVSRAGYGTIDPVAETITIERDWNAPGISSLAGVLQFREYGSYIDDLKRSETVVFANAETDPRTAARADRLKAISAQAAVNMPITEQGRFVALLYLNHATAREWPAKELAFVREIAERTQAAVARRRAEQDLRAFTASLERLVDERTAALQANEARLRTIFESSFQYQGLLTLDGTLLEANATSLAGIASTLDAVIGKPFWETPWFSATPGMPEAVREAIPVVAKGGTIRQEIHVNLPTGWRWFDFAMRPLRNEAGHIVGILPEAVETTERHLAEDALRQSQKLEAMGQLTGGVAHDFNNLLTPIIGGLDMLHRRGIGGERERRLIDGALQSAERAKTLVQRLLAFARRQPLQPTAVDVAALVTGMAGLVSSTTGPQIKVAVDVAENLPAARADPNQLEMAILNLAVNSRDAMRDGGTLRISARTETVGHGHRSKLNPGPYVCLSVADTGTGMDAATLARAIEPFFSTKGVGQGTGLGLSMVHGLASQLGGALALSSKPGLGTNVELWLPISSERVEAAEVKSGATERSSALGTALLVDDEDIVRSSTADMLAELGYEVVQAISGEEALGFMNQGLHPDVLVTDHVMPGMTGVDLARIVRERWPSTPVLIISGFAEAEGIAPDLPRLTKPFRQFELAASVASLEGN